MAKIRRCVKKMVILSSVFDADVDIRLSDKPVLRIVQIVNTAFQKRAISVMRDNGSVVVILYYSVGDKINLVINRIKKSVTALIVSTLSLSSESRKKIYFPFALESA